MLSAFGMAFKTPELRKKIFFTLSIMALFRFGSVVPTPGVSYANVKQCIDQAKGGDVTVADLIAKGAVRDSLPVKVLGNGDIAVKVSVTAHAFSASAVEKISAAGGSTATL